MPPSLSEIRQILAPYGVTLVDDEGPWNVTDASRIQLMVEKAGRQLYDFASLIYDPQIVGDVPNAFNRLFGPLPFKRGQTDTRPGTNWYGYNSGHDITLYNNAFFNGSRPLRTNPFGTTYSTEFLILHEICHKRKVRVWPKTGGAYDIDSYYLQTSNPIARRLASRLGLPATGPDLDPAGSPRTASAGFQHAARSKPNIYEFTADALANWLMDTFTDDPNGYGDLRRAQMKELFTKLLYSLFDGPPAMIVNAEAADTRAAPVLMAAGAEAVDAAPVAVLTKPNFPLRGLHGDEGASWLRNNGKQGWAVETAFANGDLTHPMPQDYSAFDGTNIRVIVRWNYSYASYDGGSGTFPTKDKYDDFSNWCVASIRDSKGVWGHIIGNEPNNPAEHPNPQNSILPEDVARVFNGVRQQLPNVRLSPAAIDPTNNVMGINPHDYWRRVLSNLRRVDFFALHAYSYGSDQAPNTAVFFDTMPKHYYSFKMWQPLADIIYNAFPERRRIPLIITETNHNYVRGSNNTVGGWDDDAGGAKWIKDVYDMVASWNRGPGAQYVHGICLYRYKGANDPRAISDKPNLINALLQCGDNPL